MGFQKRLISTVIKLVAYVNAIEIGSSSIRIKTPIIRNKGVRQGRPFSPTI
jgi:hypothetical protein